MQLCEAQRGILARIIILTYFCNCVFDGSDQPVFGLENEWNKSLEEGAIIIMNKNIISCEVVLEHSMFLESFPL